MLFTSYSFIGFVALLFVVYYLVPKKCQWLLLLAASYIFYFMAGPEYLLYIGTTTVTIWFTACVIQRQGEKSAAYIKENQQLDREEKKAWKAKGKQVQRRWLIICLLLNLGILAVVKYTDFAFTNINMLLQATGSERQLTLPDFVLPLGISFYTFQALGYLIDVYRGTVPAEKNLFRLALFVSFFPQLIQGPISRFGDLGNELYKEHSFRAETLCLGLQRILWGYFKKLVIADRILTGVNAIIREPETHGGAWVLIGMLFYALELYADFTGGIDITIGIGQTLGITVKENFHRPYFSKSIKEYWRRWHISMGTWFTDYIFYPISVSKPLLKLSKWSRAHMGEAVGKRAPVYLSSFAVWLATGVWHGASWNFIVWGLANWMVIMASQELEPLYARFHNRFPTVGGRTWYRAFQVIRTVLLMSCLRMFDCYRNVPLTFCMFGTMFTEWNWNIIWDGSLMQIGLSPTDYWVLAAGLALLLIVSLIQRRGSVRKKIAALPYPARAVLWYGLFLVVLLAGAYGIGYDASQFIYNQF